MKPDLPAPASWCKGHQFAWAYCACGHRKMRLSDGAIFAWHPTGWDAIGQSDLPLPAADGDRVSDERAVDSGGRVPPPDSRRC